MSPPREEVDRKVERMARAVREAGLRGVLITTHWNFSWLTAGGTNRIDISRESGAGALLVSSTGQRYVLANAIEMPRLSGEVLPALAFEPVEFPWIEERADPAFLTQLAHRLLGDGPIGADSTVGDARSFEAGMSKLRRVLEPEELVRYRALGADAGRAVGELLRMVPAGISEREVVREARSHCTVPTPARWSSSQPPTIALCTIVIRCRRRWSGPAVSWLRCAPSGTGSSSRSPG
jgi:Xaa-Pro aminopeptidase